MQLVRDKILLWKAYLCRKHSYIGQQWTQLSREGSWSHLVFLCNQRRNNRHSQRVIPNHLIRVLVWMSLFRGAVCASSSFLWNLQWNFLVLLLFPFESEAFSETWHKPQTVLVSLCSKDQKEVFINQNYSPVDKRDFKNLSKKKYYLMSLQIILNLYLQHLVLAESLK